MGPVLTSRNPEAWTRRPEQEGSTWLQTSKLGLGVRDLGQGAFTFVVTVLIVIREFGLKLMT